MNEFHCAKEHDLGGLPSTTPSTKTSKTSWKPYTDNKCVFVFFIILLTYFDSKASTETYSKSRYRQRHRGLPSVFCSPKAVSKGGPNKPVVSSETGVCWLLRQKKQDNTEETVSSKQLQLQQSECIVSLHVVWSGCSSPFRSNLPNNITNVSFSKCGRSINNDRKNDGKS